MRFTIINCSFDPASRSWRLAELAGRIVKSGGHQPQLIDLRTLEVQHFDNDRAYEHPAYLQLHDAISSSDGIFLCCPVYNWGLGSGVKNLIELTGATGIGGRKSPWFDKIVTFLCSGGLPHSYMAYGPVAMSLMLDFKCVLNPYMVYATERSWMEGLEPSDDLRARLDKTVSVKFELANTLKNRCYTSDWEI